ncbi:CPBP family intramembrane glutamic endopeptidase [Lacticaseibacillus thailandensis]|uniref:CAAX prenyl protease 2/Lysostaphin resistance protein A-like domain-containing protein n=1 Tax=Lacticaseibacillus thailandensis DSM 22698 = JCM 13996 TaxID=1423810 RepID=A0A0R2CHH5_9LACO|nr:type II CAAX endopeptidase family protein [Lacticaseibacillus thailandensis]KRM87660.1 hypothetical protein FD19_GL001181 [Lacticaseibacillus thailandensis DSM 22698 = JCM 13996]
MRHFSVTQRTLGFLLAFLAYQVVDVLVLPTGHHEDAGTLAVTVAGYLVLITGLYWAYRRYVRNVTPADHRRRLLSRRNWQALLGGLAILIVVQVAAWLAATYHLAPQSSNQSAVVSYLRRIPWSMSLSVGLFSPIIEELIFRGMLMNAFTAQRTRGSRWFAAIVSSIAFALVHSPGDPINFLTYCGLGAGMAFAYTWSDDLRVSMVLHVLNNCWALL